MSKIALLLSAAALVLATTAHAEGPTCHSAAAEKKLHGAAKTSFVNKCTKDAGKSCDSAAAEKKLHGAAKTSFTKKCVKDAVGA